MVHSRFMSIAFSLMYFGIHSIYYQERHLQSYYIDLHVPFLFREAEFCCIVMMSGGRAMRTGIGRHAIFFFLSFFFPCSALSCPYEQNGLGVVGRTV